MISSFILRLFYFMMPSNWAQLLPCLSRALRRPLMDSTSPSRIAFFYWSFFIIIICWVLLPPEKISWFSLPPKSYSRPPGAEALSGFRPEAPLPLSCPGIKPISFRPVSFFPAPFSPAPGGTLNSFGKFFCNYLSLRIYYSVWSLAVCSFWFSRSFSFNS